MERMNMLYESFLRSFTLSPDASRNVNVNSICPRHKKLMPFSTCYESWSHKRSAKLKADEIQK